MFENIRLYQKKKEGTKNTKKKYANMLAGFFVLMLVFTLISRTASSVITPRVTVIKHGRGVLSYEWQGNGNIRTTLENMITLEEGLRVEQVVSVGTVVRNGDLLLKYNMESLQEKKENLEVEIQKLKLQMEQQRLSGTPDASTPEQVTALRNLIQAEEQLAAVQTELTNAQMNLEQAQANPENAQQSETASNVQEAAARMSELEQVKEQVQSAVVAAQNAYEDARRNDANYKKNQDKASQISSLVQEGIQIDIDVKEKEFAKIEELIMANGEIKAQQDGVVTGISSVAGGITSEQDVIRIGIGGNEFAGTLDHTAKGKVQAGDMITVTLPEEGGVYQVPITQVEAENAGEVNQTEDSAATGTKDGIKIRASLGEIMTQPGTSASFTINKTSDIQYSHVLPVQAVWEDKNGKFCLVAREKETILGKEYIAVRVNLKEIARDNERVAVEGALTEDQLIIKESNKNIEKGDRLRIEK